jgi:hypothetical protein
MSAVQKNTNQATLSLHDPEFKNLISVPLSAVHHLPPAHLEISRLVLCRKYDPRDPANSCPMGDSCKFVHIDMSTPQLTVQSIHVNYAYRSLEEVTHERLPAGESLAVMAPNNRAPSQLVPSEMVLVTRGALNRHSGKGPLSHCAHYFYNRMCNRGERCSFLHCLFVDPSATEFQRAPPRAGASVSSTVQPQASRPQQQAAAPATAALPPMAHHMPTSFAAPHTQSEMMIKTCSSLQEVGSSSCDLSESPRSHRSEEHSSTPSSLSTLETSSMTSARSGKRAHYRRNPYSLIETTVVVA